MPNSPLTLRSRLGKVCVAITGTSPDDMLEKAAATARETPFLEFRLDYLAKPAEALPSLKQFLVEHSAVTAIATCRGTGYGGRFAGSPVQQLDILTQAAAAGSHIVDLELEAAEALKPEQVATLRTTASLIVSYHNFKETRDLDAIYDRMKRFTPDFVKLVPTAKTLTDNITLMRCMEQIADQTPVVGICMGDAGIISRVLGLRAGSIFTFAAASQGEETGPGQITARTLVETYRIEEIDAATKVFGVAGNPVNKSLSPIMMNTAFRRETVNAVYLALQTAKVEDLITLIKEVPVQGVSITMPHKQAILPFLEKTDPLTQKIGACNTILRGPEGKLYGFNTDVAGVVVPLERRMRLAGAKILVLGAGGTARAAVFGLRDKGAEVSILNRTVETGEKLAKQAGAKIVKRELVLKTAWDVIINATSVGMSGQKGAQILTEADFAAGLNAKFVYDLVYNPVETPLLKLARQHALGVITGVEMFVQQGARQFEIWTGKPAPQDEMLKVVVHALRQTTDVSSAPLSSTPKEQRLSVEEELPDEDEQAPPVVQESPKKITSRKKPSKK